jgi:hypothetical protein
VGISTLRGPVQALERVRVGTWYVRARSYDIVVGPEGHSEAVAFVDPRLNRGVSTTTGLAVE